MKPANVQWKEQLISSSKSSVPIVVSHTVHRTGRVKCVKNTSKSERKLQQKIILEDVQTTNQHLRHPIFQPFHNLVCQSATIRLQVSSLAATPLQFGLDPARNQVPFLWKMQPPSIQQQSCCLSSPPCGPSFSSAVRVLTKYVFLANSLSVMDSRSLKIILWNARSVKQKQMELLDLASREDADILVITETYLKPEICFSLPGYN